MATVRATCSHCGDIELTSGDVTVLVDPTNGQGSYCFVCPDCQVEDIRPAQAKIVEALVLANCRLVVLPPTADTLQPMRHQPITHDDVASFMAALEGIGTLKQLEQALGETPNERSA